MRPENECGDAENGGTRATEGLVQLYDATPAIGIVGRVFICAACTRNATAVWARRATARPALKPG